MTLDFRKRLIITSNIVKYETIYNKHFKILTAFVLYLFCSILRFINRSSADKLIMFSHRYSDSALVQMLLHKRIIKIINRDHFGSLVHYETLTKDTAMRFLKNRIMVLKPFKSTREKGVVLVKFTETFSLFLKNYDVNNLLNDYYVILDPSWTGYCDPSILIFSKFKQSPIIIGASGQLDYDLIKKLDTNLVPMRFGAGNWVDHNWFRPLPDIEKKYDVLMVAQWRWHKRHYALFRALSNLKGNKLKIALAGGSYKSNLSEIKELVAYYGLKNEITFFVDLPYQEMNMLYNESKVNVLLSYKEGASKCLFEGMFANTPAILLKNNIGVNKNCINRETGMLIDEKCLPETLLMFSKDYAKFSPRKWVMENISCIKTTAALNEAIKRFARKNNEEWTEDLRIKVNRPENDYLYESDKVIDHHLDTYMKTV